MKKRGVLLLLLLGLVLVQGVSATQSWNFRYTPECKICWEGFVVNSSLDLVNTGDAELNVLNMYLIDYDGIQFFSSFVNATITPGETLTLRFPVHLPPPTRGMTLFYKLCLELPTGLSCSRDYSRMIIRPLSELECIDDNGCAYNQKCLNFKCVEFYCPGIAVDHDCVTQESSLK
ncbi:hypothetical protein DRJ48_01255, partial [Candidatus Woesearchaeota archaeon]